MKDATADQVQSPITSADGNYDIFEHLKLSGEPLIPQLIPDFPGGKPGPVYNAIAVEKTALKLNECQVRYRDAVDSERYKHWQDKPDSASGSMVC